MIRYAFLIVNRESFSSYFSKAVETFEIYTVVSRTLNGVYFVGSGYSFRLNENHALSFRNISTKIGMQMHLLNLWWIICQTQTDWKTTTYKPHTKYCLHMHSWFSPKNIISNEKQTPTDMCDLQLSCWNPVFLMLAKLRASWRLFSSDDPIAESTDTNRKFGCRRSAHS